MFVRSTDRGAYLEGTTAATEAASAAEGPIKPPWREVAPAWALEATFQAYSWQKGFAVSWNWWCNKRDWPEWARMPLVLPRVRPDGDAAC